MRNLASSDLIYDISIHFADDFMVLIARLKSSIHPFSSGYPYQWHREAGAYPSYYRANTEQQPI